MPALILKQRRCGCYDQAFLVFTIRTPAVMQGCISLRVLFYYGTSAQIIQFLSNRKGKLFQLDFSLEIRSNWKALITDAYIDQAIVR
jgi:hypothetical protein